MVRFAVALALLVGGCGFRAALVDAGGGDIVAGDDDGIVIHDAPIAIMPVQMGTSTAGGSHMSDSVNLTSSLGAGDLIVVAVSWAGGASAATCADSAGNTYKPLGAITSSGPVTQASFYAEGIRGSTADTVTVTLTSNEDNIALRVIEYSGIAATDALDQEAITTGMGSTATSPTVTTTHAHELVYGASTNGGTADGAGQGYIQRLLYAGDVVEDREVTAIDAYSASVDIGTPPEAWIMLIATFRAAS